MGVSWSRVAARIGLVTATLVVGALAEYVGGASAAPRPVPIAASATPAHATTEIGADAIRVCHSGEVCAATPVSAGPARTNYLSCTYFSKATVCNVQNGDRYYIYDRRTDGKHAEVRVDTQAGNVAWCYGPTDQAGTWSACVYDTTDGDTLRMSATLNELGPHVYYGTVEFVNKH